MIVDSKQLEKWLHQKLKPLCVADPVPLSQYVIALLKKDKPENELKDICIDQLEVFLQENTTNFVNDLFLTLSDRSYVVQEAVTNEERNSIPVISKTQYPKISTESSREKKRQAHSEHVSDLVDAKRRRDRSTSQKAKSSNHSNSRSRSPQLSSRSANSSASGSQKSVRKDNNRDSSPDAAKRKTDRVDDSAIHRGNTRLSRVEADAHCPRIHGYESDSRRERPTRERLRSPERSRHGSKPRSQPDERAGNIKRRCREFDEQGFCALGSECAFDHGPDALVMPSAQAAAAITKLSSTSYSLSNTAGSSSSVTYSSRIPSVVSTVVSDASSTKFFNADDVTYKPTSMLTSASMESTGSEDRGNDEPITAIQPIIRSNRGLLGPTPIRRNVVPIPRVSIPDFKSNASRAPPAYEPDKPQISVLPTTSSPNNAAAAPSEPHMIYTPSPIIDRTAVTAIESSFPCELYVTRLPWRLNNEAKLREHFSRFGTLVRVVARYMGIPDTALVEYSNPDEAENTFRSPEPILSNRFIRLSTSLQNRPGRFRRGRQTPYEMRSGTVRDRLGPLSSNSNRTGFEWLKAAVDGPRYDFHSGANSAPKSSSSRWRLERNGAPDPNSDDDADDGVNRARDDEDMDAYRTDSYDGGSGYDQTFNGINNTLGPKPSLPRSHFKFSVSYKDKQETAAYLWRKQKDLALKQREEQLRSFDKSKETKQNILQTQKQRAIRLQAELRNVMSELEELAKHPSKELPEVKSAKRANLLAKAKRLEDELETVLELEKKCLSNKLRSDSTTPSSTYALQALPEPLAAERRKQIAEVQAALKQVEEDMAVVKSKGEPVTELCRRVLELKRRLVQLETIRPSDFTESSGGDPSDASGVYPSRAQTKLDKRPRTLFISGLPHSDVTSFQRALNINYLHHQSVVKHAEPGTDKPVLEITFCTRDFAEAAIKLFSHFHGNSLTMSFESPPLADSMQKTIVSSQASVVSSSQSEAPIESDSVHSVVSSNSAHPSPTSTTVPANE